MGSLTFHHLIIAYILLCPLVVCAKDFGIESTTFKIIEEPFLEMLKKRLTAIDLAKEEEKIKERISKKINNPPSVMGIRKAKEARSFYFDPTYVLKEDILLPCGKVLHKAGTKVNPLAHENLDRRLFFVDGRDSEQMSWLKEQLFFSDKEENKSEIIENRIILIGGSVFKVSEELESFYKDDVYFDQNGEITGIFGIKATPAVAVQEGFMIKIEEIKL